MTTATEQLERSALAGRELIVPTVFWLVFALVAVLLRGVRWDENYEFAQAMTGAVAYPEGHPIVVWTRGMYNAQFWFSAWMEGRTDSALVLNGFRNYLFLVASTVPPFLLGRVLSRQALVGHVCVVFVLAGIHLEFDGSYPQMLWPGMFSNGHIGTGFALATAALFAGGYLRTASLMLGVMPLVHLGQAPPLFLLAGAWGGYKLYRGDFAPLRRGVPFLLAGLVVSLASFLVHQGYAVTPPTEGPYAGTADGETVRLGITQHYDMHRSIPVGNSHLIPIFSAVVWFAGLRLLPQGRAQRAWNLLGAYGACVMAIHYGVVVAHLLMGPDIPYLLIGWLPYRLANHLPPIVLALCIALLMRRNRDDDSAPFVESWIVVALLFFLVGRPLFGFVLPEGLFTAYFSATDSVLFALAGAACSAAAGTRDDWTLPYLLLLAPALLVIAWMHQFGAACVVAGFLGVRLAVIFRDRLAPLAPALRPACAAGALSGLLLVTANEYRYRAHLPVGAFEENLRGYLAERGASGAMLLGPPFQLMLQAQTGHPVMADMATHYFPSYRPAIGPSVDAVYSELYGIDLTSAPRIERGWQIVWESRDAAEWRTLAETWDFRYVVAPNDVGVRLPRVLEGGHDSLYLAMYDTPEPQNDSSTP